MQIDDFKNYSADCFRDAVPPCSCVCPLGLDVRAVIEKLQRGNFTAAYRLYRNQTLFPGIVSRICPEPCREACVRGKADAAIHMRDLEAACVAFTKDSEPIAYNVPKKDFTIAVVGAGLSGLSCALKLASRNYTVTVYERGASVGGRLHGLLEPEIFLPEIEKQFSSVDCGFLLSTPVNSLDDITADAIYIAAGSESDGFGLTASTDNNALATSRHGVFLGGGLLGASPVEAVEHGVRASYSIEKFLKTGAMDGVPETWARPRLNKEFYGLPVTPQPSTLHGKNGDAAVTPETAAEESSRCLRCNCSQCRDECGLMQKFGLYPPRITTDIISTMRAMDKFSGRIASRMINSCSQCGLCKTVCPEQIDMEDCFLEARRMLHRDGAMPPVYHDFWMRDMHFSNTDARTVYAPEGTCAYLFFPGCQLGASDPAYVIKTYDALSALCPGTALVAGCCGVPADWAGDEPLRDGVLDLLRAEWEKLGKPVIVPACPTCRKTLRRYLPECATQSLYELLAEADVRAESGPAPVRIFDSCASRHDPLMRQSVRTLALHAGLAADEPDGSGGAIRCCGYGGHIQAVNPELADALTAAQAGIHDAEYITYCTNCRDSFAAAGKACRHILDVLFTGNPADRKPPSLTQRRRNRLEIRREFARRAGTPIPELPQGESMILHIPEELSNKMDRLLILEDEVRQAVLHCENSGEKLKDTVSGRFIGHCKIGLITYWVTYTQDNNGYTLHNIYTHRLTIEE